jgi:hypothetical protein
MNREVDQSPSKWAGEPGDQRIPRIRISLTDPQPQQRRNHPQAVRHQHRLLPLTRLNLTDQENRSSLFEHMLDYATAD